MAEFLGLAAGAGMLSLIGWLFVRFLRETGAMRPETARTLLHSFLAAAGGCAAYFLAAALICHMTRQEIGRPALISKVFSGEKTQEAFKALKNPSWTGPLSGLFAYIGHYLGLLLFEQYEFAGVALAFLMTAVSLCLLTCRLRQLLSDQTAKEIAFLLLCLPGGVFFFLPGWAPAALLILSAAFAVLGKRLPRPKRSARFPAYSLILALSAALSAFALAGAVSGWIG